MRMAMLGKWRPKVSAYSLEIPYFQIFYSGSYIVLLLILLVLLTTTPAEFIYQIITNRKIGNVFVVAATYVVTPLIALFIYASRLYTNRTTLASIPRPYLPIEQDEVSKKVRRIIVRNRERSALVAFESRPRDLGATKDVVSGFGSSESSPPSPAVVDGDGKTQDDAKREALPQISATSPPWGIIQHPGWSSPSAEDIPSLEFQTVYTELPNLIEAKVVALAAPDRSLQTDSERDTLELFKRPANMGMRGYLNRLRASNVVIPQALVQSFLAKYENARFSARPISESGFRDLMDCFSNILSSIQLSAAQDDSSYSSESIESVESVSQASLSRSILTRQVTSQSGIDSIASPSLQPAMTSPSSASLDSVIIHR